MCSRARLEALASCKETASQKRLQPGTVWRMRLNERLRRKALATPTRKERHALLRKARQIETAADIDKWLSSPGLQAPQ
jgi:hypothetical protein